MERSKRGGRTVYLHDVGVWWNESQDNIHITVKGVAGFHSTINANPQSKRRNPNHVCDQALFIATASRPTPLRRTMLAQNPADTPFRHIHQAENLIDAGAPTRRAQKFPRDASVRISLSSVRSDTTRRRCSFSL